MDRKIENKSLLKHKYVKYAIAGSLLVVVAYFVLYIDTARSYRIDAERLTVSTVNNGIFNDAVPVNGAIEPLKIVYLDTVQGGVVDEIYVTEGDFVEAGQKILAFKNTSFQLEIFSQEARVSEQLDINANTRLSLDKNELELREKLNKVEYNIKNLKRQVKSKKSLLENKHIAKDDFDAVQDEYDYNVKLLSILREAQAQERAIHDIKVRQLKESEERLHDHLNVIRSSMDNLIVTAPISGQLTSLDVEAGESKSPGDRLGQVDKVDGYKLVANVDSFYLSRVRTGQQATYRDDQGEYALRLSRVYPEVKNGTFIVDFVFIEKSPENIRRGQNLVVDLILGEAKNSLLVKNGGFYSDTGGNWAFVLEPSSNIATKRRITLGRRNNQYIEVVSGLQAGEQVITSSYSGYGNVEKLEINGLN